MAEVEAQIKETQEKNRNASTERERIASRAASTHRVPAMRPGSLMATAWPVRGSPAIMGPWWVMTTSRGRELIQYL